MIEFITLFLGGLITGPQTIEFMVDETVAIVEVWMDGELQERLNTPPWRLEMDFGSELMPHILEAVALDSEQEELARTRQWINMSPEPAQSSLMIEGAQQGQGAIARVSWESLADRGEPESVEVLFDGLQVQADDPRAIQLPPFDPDQTHHLQVRLGFTDVLFSEAEVVFGGVYGNEISTEISAVPIRFEKGRKPKKASAIKDWFTVGGVPQNVHALDKGAAEIVVVRDVTTASRLSEMSEQVARLNTDFHLEKHHRISFINPCPEIQHKAGGRMRIFPHTRRFTSEDGTLLRLLERSWTNECPAERQQLANAVGVAGLSASGDGSRRVVILIVNGDPPDHGDLRPGQVIPYLQRLGVPLVIWNVDSAKHQVSAWGQMTDVSKVNRFRKAFNAVETNLEHQLIVWLEGLHLPQSIELKSGIDGISLVE